MQDGTANKCQQITINW